MNAADRSTKRVHELTRSMAPLVHIPLSRPATRCPAAHELLAQEQRAIAARPKVRTDPQIPLAHRVVGWAVFAIVFGGIGVLLAWRG